MVLEPFSRAFRGFGFLFCSGMIEQVLQTPEQLLPFLSPFNFMDSGKFPERGKSLTHPLQHLFQSPPPTILCGAIGEEGTPRAVSVLRFFPLLIFLPSKPPESCWMLL